MILIASLQWQRTQQLSPSMQVENLHLLWTADGMEYLHPFGYLPTGTA
jgi:hypothetical protein